MADLDREARFFHRLYWLVIAVLAVEVAVFWIITRAFS
jgi:hypothetical protein